ncbi:MAG: hypothetical protein OHK0046_15690 [Anaerolineae bacterium]
MKRILILLLALSAALVACSDNPGTAVPGESDPPPLDLGEGNNAEDTVDQQNIADPTFNITLNGPESLSISQENAEYTHDFEESVINPSDVVDVPEEPVDGNPDAIGSGNAVGDAGTLDDDDAPPNVGGLYQLEFTGGELEVYLQFSDGVTVGTYPVGVATGASAEGSTELSTIQNIIAVNVVANGESYNNLTDGSLTFDEFGDDRTSGSFDFVISSGAEGDSVTLTGAFNALPLETTPYEALDDEVEDARDVEEIGAEAGEDTEDGS